MSDLDWGDGPMARGHRGASLSWLIGATLMSGASAQDIPAGQGMVPADRAAQGAAVLPGTRVVVGVAGPIDPGATYRWTQVEGPPVAIEDPAASKIRFVVPPGADRLEFLAAIRDKSGEQNCRVTVPIARATTRPAPAADATPPQAGAPPKADGGEDARGVVGRPITLDGSRSSPSGRVGFRWLPLSGPALSNWKVDGAAVTFTPGQPGTYRFLLLVAVGGSISEPDIVEVEVAEEPATAPGPDPETPLSRSIAAAVAPIPGGQDTASQVADVFEAVAGRVPLYSSYAQLQSELVRRLDVVVPSEPQARAAWTNSVFAPLTQIASIELARIGVDVRPEQADRTLVPAQRERLQELYRGLADACRPRIARP